MLGCAHMFYYRQAFSLNFLDDFIIVRKRQEVYKNIAKNKFIKLILFVRNYYLWNLWWLLVFFIQSENLCGFFKIDISCKCYFTINRSTSHLFKMGLWLKSKRSTVFYGETFTKNSYVLWVHCIGTNHTIFDSFTNPLA